MPRSLRRVGALPLVVVALCFARAWTLSNRLVEGMSQSASGSGHTVGFGELEVSIPRAETCRLPLDCHARTGECSLRLQGMQPCVQMHDHTCVRQAQWRTQVAEVPAALCWLSVSGMMLKCTIACVSQAVRARVQLQAPCIPSMCIPAHAYRTCSHRRVMQLTCPSSPFVLQDEWWIKILPLSCLLPACRPRSSFQHAPVRLHAPPYIPHLPCTGGVAR